MRSQDNGRAVRGQLADQRMQFGTRVYVEAGGRFVEEEHLRPVSCSKREGQPALLSDRERAELGVAPLAQSEPIEKIKARGLAMICGEESNSLTRGHADRQGRGLELYADERCELSALPAGIHAEDVELPRVSPPQSFEAFEGGGFARAVWTKQAKDFAAAHVERDGIDRAMAAVSLGKVTHVDGNVLHGGSLRVADPRLLRSAWLRSIQRVVREKRSQVARRHQAQPGLPTYMTRIIACISGECYIIHVARIIFSVGGVANFVLWSARHACQAPGG